MSEYTLQLPETLVQQLEHLAVREGVPLNQYLVYALTKQVAWAYAIQVSTPQQVAQQQRELEGLWQSLSKPSAEQVDALLAKRERVAPEVDLHPETVEKLQRLIANQASAVA